MSKGPGTIERRIADLFAATRDRALSIDDVTAHAFNLKGKPPTRAQRLSATRAAHRLLRRVREADEQIEKLRCQAHAETKAALGREQFPFDRKALRSDDDYNKLLESRPSFIECRRLRDFQYRIGIWSRIMRGDRPGWLKAEDDHWQVITLKGRLYFHPPDVPVQVWAVRIDAGGVHWFDAEVTKITQRNVMVRYKGESARLDSESLWRWWAFWRRVMFVSSRSGRIAAELDKLWHRRYGTSGSVPPSMQMPLDQAMRLLGVPADYSREDVISGFRRAAKKAHPDVGGTPEMFRLLVEARDRLLAALGTSAPAPKPPVYAPKGAHIVYRRTSSSSSQGRIGSGTPRLT